MSKQPHQHFSFTVPSEVMNICRPLVDFFDANFFIYQRSFIDEQAMCVNSSALLCNNIEALKYILSIPQKNREKAKYDYINSGRKYVLVETTQPQFTAILQQKFNFNNILCRDELLPGNEWEHFMMGTCSNNTGIINSYLNNTERLDKFITYFRDRAAKLINKACNDRFASGRPIEKCDFRNFTKIKDDHRIEKFMMLPAPKRYCLTNLYKQKIEVPKAEMHCLIKLSQGRSRKEVAMEVGISPRTVESHLRNAKFRLKCNTRKEILTILEIWKKTNTWFLADI